MAIPVTIPRLGWNMEEGTFVAWLKRDGDSVTAGEALFSLEGDKATQDIESLEAGILRIPPDAPQEGERVAVGVLVGYLVSPGEAPPFEHQAGARAPSADRPTSTGAGDNAAIAASASGTASRAPADLRAARGRISPRARRVARELGIDPAALRGTGAGGRVRERDVRDAAHAVRHARANAIAPGVRVHHAAPAVGAESTPPGEFRVIPVTPVRRTIAERMLHSAQMTAAVTLTTTVDATNLVSLRAQFKAVTPAGGEPAVSVTDVIVKLGALALQQYPLLNARWEGDKILVPADVHVGIAVDTQAGLLVPVVRDVAGLTLRQLAAVSRDLIERARKGGLVATELSGSTFTVTNLGPMGIETFTPLINPPNCAVLGLGRIARQVVVEQTQFVARDRMFLSLTFDHRVVDGAPAAQFLQTLGTLIENPGPWLMP